MSSIISTYKKLEESSPQITSKPTRYSLFTYLSKGIENSTLGVFVRYNIDEEYETELTSDDLTLSSMTLSQTSFSEEWNNEDDEYWNSYL